MKVFITGASGFIGRHILNELKAEQVLALDIDRVLNGLAMENVSTVAGDMNDVASFGKELIAFDPDTVLHLAWQGIPDFSEKMSQTNLKNSISLIDLLAEKTNCRKILASGSCFEYGAVSGACSEDQKLNINSFFAWAKVSLFEYLKLACNKKNIVYVWPRIFYVYGPGQREGSLIPTIVKSIVAGKKPDIRRPFDANDFVYVGDVAKAFASAVKNNIPSGAYNLGTGRSTKVIEVCEIIEEEIMRSKRFSSDIRGQTDTAANSVDFWADTKNSRQSLGWEATTTISEGISEYIKSIAGAQ